LRLRCKLTKTENISITHSAVSHTNLIYFEIMKIWSTEHIFNHPWEKVTAAAWRKYPNELNPDVKQIDVYERDVTKDGKLVTKRVFGNTMMLPALLGQLLGLPDMCYAIEHITVDPVAKTMTLRMLNHTFCGILSCNEKLVYRQSTDDENVTVLEQSANINVTGISFQNYFENLIVKGFDKNCVKGRQAIENVVGLINTEMDELVKTFDTEVQELSRSFDKKLQTLDTEVKELSRNFDKAISTISPINQASCEGATDVNHDKIDREEREAIYDHDEAPTNNNQMNEPTNEQTNQHTTATPLNLVDTITERGITAKVF